MPDEMLPDDHELMLPPLRDDYTIREMEEESEVNYIQDKGKSNCYSINYCISVCIIINAWRRHTSCNNYFPKIKKLHSLSILLFAVRIVNGHDRKFRIMRQRNEDVIQRQCMLCYEMLTLEWVTVAYCNLDGTV